MIRAKEEENLKKENCSTELDAGDGQRRSVSSIDGVGHSAICHPHSGALVYGTSITGRSPVTLIGRKRHGKLNTSS